MKIMHDQEIMDELLEKFGEDAAEEFGDCLSVFNNPADPEDCPHELMRKMIWIANQTLKKIGSNLQVEVLVGSDDDGYYWEVSE